MRTVAGWIFSSSLTCGTVSHGSSPASGVLEIASGIECVDGPRREIYQLGKSEHSRAHNGGILRRRDRRQSNGRSAGKGHRWNGAGAPLASLTDRDARRRPRDGGPVRRAQGLRRARCWSRPTCWMVSRATSQTSRLLRLCRLETSRLRMMAGAPTAPRPGASEHRNPFLMPEAEAAVMRAPAKRWFQPFRRTCGDHQADRVARVADKAPGRASPCHQARSARRRRGERVRCGRHWRRRPHRCTPWFGPLTIDTERRSNRLTRPAKRHLAAHHAAPSPAISDPTIEGPHQPRRPTPQSPDTCFASHRGCGSLHATADSN